ncbi:hypothetical protein [Acetobacter conturbans]|uniref:hypothetical protein n=1 Tax=Acetobacter conturbans TaxID=1737472 RepID=UPI001F54F2B1|nr:hypothetical protein [Acetobacter conturbans]
MSAVKARFFVLVAALSSPFCLGSTAVRAEESASAAGPYVTPSVDVFVRYEMVRPDGAGLVHQDMHWQVASLRQRIDPENSAVYMLTSWRDHTLTVVDTLSHRRSVMPAPGGALSMPGQVPSGSFQRLGTAIVAGQFCTNWRTADADGRSGDACYTQDGILMQVMQKGQVVVRAVSVDRIAQPDSLFVVPETYKLVAPAR